MIVHFSILGGVLFASLLWENKIRFGGSEHGSSADC